VDFGIARQAGSQQAANLGLVTGTPEYMSPEQFIDSDKIDHRSDVYSAGILLFKMLTGQLPFKGTFLEALKEQHLNAPVPNPRRLNPKIRKCLGEIVVKAIQKDRDARFQGGLEFLKEIEACERGRSWQVALLSLSIILAAGVWYFVQNEKAVRSLASLAIDNYALLCREAETLKRKETGLRIAKESGDSAMTEAFLESIAAHNVNIAEFYRDYRSAFDELSKYRDSTVLKIFSKPEKVDDRDGSGAQQTDKLQRSRFWELASNDYEQFKVGHQSSAMEGMLEKCP
jgi:serine/threonine protein kinase